MFETAYVIIGMVAYAMPRVSDHSQFVRMFIGVLAHHKERGVDVIVFQNIEHPRSDNGNGSVVKREVNSPFLRVYSP